MKTFTKLLFLLICITTARAQSPQIDSVNKLIASATSDTARLNQMNKKNALLGNINLDSAIELGKQIIAEAQKINYPKAEASAKRRLGVNYCFKGLYNEGKSNIADALAIYTRIKDTSGQASSYSSLGIYYGMQSIYDSSILAYKKAEALASKIKDEETLNNIYMNIAISYQMVSDFPRSLTYFQKALKPAEQKNDISNQAFIHVNLGITLMNIGDTTRAEQSFIKAVNLGKKAGLKNVLIYSYSNLSSIYQQQNKQQESYSVAMQAATLAKENGDDGMEASALARAGIALANMSRFAEAEAIVRKAIPIAEASNQPINIYQTNVDMGSVLKMAQKCAAAIPYYEKGFKALQNSDIYDRQVGNSYHELSECYEETGDYKKALSAYRTSAQIADSMRSRENVRKATELNMSYEFDKKQQLAKAEQQKKDEIAKTKQTALIVGLALTLLLAVVAFTAFRNKRKANLLLQQQKEEIQLQKEQVQTALADLETTQAQLIQSEKMASLGELTAGIAHEIQNPLNFVNNFSEVTVELVDEMEKEFMGDNKYAAFTLSEEVKQNLQKIVYHGKRADSIVKGMLQHSRTSTGKKEPVDLNALADEYMRLSYHGLRAKDSSFNVAMQTNFDEHLQKVNMISQNIGRVLLNLFNNAFYSVNEKKKTAGEGYKPTITVTTKQENNNAVIIVKDNGLGIPKQVADKVFQPFFTTKPTGQGTGLGLSLSYDIITKEHKGTIHVDTTEGEGATFTISLPVHSN